MHTLTCPGSLLPAGEGQDEGRFCAAWPSPRPSRPHPHSDRNRDSHLLPLSQSERDRARARIGSPPSPACGRGNEGEGPHPRPFSRREKGVSRGALARTLFSLGAKGEGKRPSSPSLLPDPHPLPSPADAGEGESVGIDTFDREGSEPSAPWGARFIHFEREASRCALGRALVHFGRKATRTIWRPDQ